MRISELTLICFQLDEIVLQKILSYLLFIRFKLHIFWNKAISNVEFLYAFSIKK